MTATTLNNGYLQANRWVNSAGTAYNALVGYKSYIHLGNEGNNGFYIAAYTEYVTPVTISYTPKYASSVLLVEGAAASRFVNSYGQRALIRRDGIVVGAGYNGCGDFHYKEDNVNHHNDMRVHAVVPANSTAATTFTISLFSWNDTSEFFGGLGSNYINVWEFQQ